MFLFVLLRIALCKARVILGDSRDQRVKVLRHVVLEVFTAGLEIRQHTSDVFVGDQNSGVSRIADYPEFLETDIVPGPILDTAVAPDINMGVILHAHLRETVNESLLLDGVEEKRLGVENSATALCRKGGRGEQRLVREGQQVQRHVVEQHVLLRDAVQLGLHCIVHLSGR